MRIAATTLQKALDGAERPHKSSSTNGSFHRYRYAFTLNKFMSCAALERHNSPHVLALIQAACPAPFRLYGIWQSDIHGLARQRVQRAIDDMGVELRDLVKAAGDAPSRIPASVLDSLADTHSFEKTEQEQEFAHFVALYALVAARLSSVAPASLVGHRRRLEIDKANRTITIDGESILLTSTKSSRAIDLFEKLIAYREAMAGGIEEETSSRMVKGEKWTEFISTLPVLVNELIRKRTPRFGGYSLYDNVIVEVT